MSTNMAMVEYFISEFYGAKSVLLDVMVTDDFRFEMKGSPTLGFKKYVLMTMAIRNLVNLNIYDIYSDDDLVFEMKYLLDVMMIKGGFDSEINGTITVTVRDNLISKISVTRSRIDEDLQKFMPE